MTNILERLPGENVGIPWKEASAIVIEDRLVLRILAFLCKLLPPCRRYTVALEVGILLCERVSS